MWLKVNMKFVWKLTVFGAVAHVFTHTHKHPSIHRHLASPPLTAILSWTSWRWRMSATSALLLLLTTSEVTVQHQTLSAAIEGGSSHWRKQEPEWSTAISSTPLMDRSDIKVRQDGARVAVQIKSSTKRTTIAQTPKAPPGIQQWCRRYGRFSMNPRKANMHTSHISDEPLYFKV